MRLSLALVLQFDGSLRQPSDRLNGMTMDPKRLGVGIGSCSAALLSGDGELIHLTSKQIPPFPGLNAAHTEYEGLLLGLGTLLSAIKEDSESLKELKTRDSPAITVQGDCKAVIDQMNCKSKPRMMEVNFRKAIDLKDRIEKEYAQLGNDNLTISFEHVPREMNTLCDEACQQAAYEKQDEAERALWDRIQKSSHSKTDNEPCRSNQAPNLSSLLNEVLNSPLICSSARIFFACELTDLAMETQDAATLRDASDFFFEMSRRWSKLYYLNDSNQQMKVTLKAVGRDVKRLSELRPGKRKKQQGLTKLEGDELAANLQVLILLFGFHRQRNSQQDLKSGNRTNDCIITP